MRGGEEEREQVVVLNVQDPGREFEQRAAYQQRERQPFQRMRGAQRRRPFEQFRDHRPQLGQHDRERRQADRHVQSLSQRVQPARVRRKREQVEVQRPQGPSNRVAAQAWVVDVV